MWRTLALAVTLTWIASPARAQTNSNLCALLPDTDVTAVVGTPVKLSAKPIETNKTGGGGTLRSQQCDYDPPRGIGTGPTTVRVTISEASSPSVAAQWFKTDAETLRPMGAGNGQRLSGIGDEAFAFQKAGGVYMRKQSVMVDIIVGRRDLDLQKEVDQGKQIAQRAAARIK
jgi:hypothetical protein